MTGLPAADLLEELARDLVAEDELLAVSERAQRQDADDHGQQRERGFVELHEKTEIAIVPADQEGERHARGEHGAMSEAGQEVFFEAGRGENLGGRRCADGVQGAKKHHEEHGAQAHDRQLVGAERLADFFEARTASRRHQEVGHEGQDQ